MFIINSPVEDLIEINKQIFLLKIFSPEIASIIKPGQFLNIRVSESVYPLLRRPFSVCDVDGEHIYILFNIMGQGTNILAHKPKGSEIDILGPLGNGFNLHGNFETAVIVAGGLGAAPFPYFTRELIHKKELLSFIGGRTKNDVISYNLKNVQEATEDGSLGFKGNVIQLLEKKYFNSKINKDKNFCLWSNRNVKISERFLYKK